MVAPYSGPMLPMVARSARLKLESPGAVELDEFFDHAFFAQHLHDGEHQDPWPSRLRAACRAI